MKLKNVLLLTTPSSPGRFAGVARFARANAWHLTVADRLTHALDGWTGDGALVTLRDDETIMRHVRSLRKHGIPVVDLTLTRPDVPLPRVAGDNAAIGRAAAAHFASRYFRHAAWFSTGWGHQHELRFKAFADALVTAPERWAWELTTQKAKADDWHSLSRWLARRLSSAKRPLGVFCFDDADASRVESAALAAGLSIPADVAILGAGDDAPLCQSQMVPISSVRHDLERNGYAGAALLARLMSGGKPPSEPILIAPRGIAERVCVRPRASTVNHAARRVAWSITRNSRPCVRRRHRPASCKATRTPAYRRRQKDDDRWQALAKRNIRRARLLQSGVLQQLIPPCNGAFPTHMAKKRQSISGRLATQKKAHQLILTGSPASCKVRLMSAIE